MWVTLFKVRMQIHKFKDRNDIQTVKLLKNLFIINLRIGETFIHLSYIFYTYDHLSRKEFKHIKQTVQILLDINIIR